VVDARRRRARAVPLGPATPAACCARWQWGQRRGMGMLCPHSARESAERGFSFAAAAAPNKRKPVEQIIRSELPWSSGFEHARLYRVCDRSPAVLRGSGGARPVAGSAQTTPSKGNLDFSTSKVRFGTQRGNFRGRRPLEPEREFPVFNERHLFPGGRGGVRQSPASIPDRSGAHHVRPLPQPIIVASGDPSVAPSEGRATHRRQRHRLRQRLQ
jgi:hypothetical protein